MQAHIPLFPEQASTFAESTDQLYFFLIAITIFFTVLIVSLVGFFSIKYRRRSDSDRPPMTSASIILEATWIIIPLAISLVIFVWGAKIFFSMSSPPQDCLEIYVTGKQWMWKIQHTDGFREINQLHVPVGKPVRLTMTSEDVIHSFYIPAFRLKGDVLPGSYTKIWFQATKPGHYHLFCAEYCGTNHSGMIGEVVVMEPQDYQNWLANGGENSLVEAGQKLFNSLACNSCHAQDSLAHGPNLEGIFGRQTRLTDGSIVKSDESYLRESIISPNSKVVEGYQANMPSFQGIITEEQVIQLIAYMKSIGVTKVIETPTKIESKPTESKPGENKPTTESKPTENKPVENKSTTESKPVENKPVENKPVDNKTGATPTKSSVTGATTPKLPTGN